MPELHQKTETFMGYRLRASAYFWELPQSDVSKMAHGCGPGSGWKEDIIPDSILGVSILPACIIHDCEYFIGKTIQDKESADLNFLENMLTIIVKESTFFLLRWLRRRIVFDYYSAVSDAGGQSFWEGKEGVPTHD